MPEGEVPEIPKHLTESLPSAENAEASFKHDQFVTALAWQNEIPQSSLENETVRRYMSAWEHLQGAFMRAGTSSRHTKSRERIRLTQEKSLYYLGMDVLRETVDGKNLYLDKMDGELNFLARSVGARIELTSAGLGPSEVQSGLWWTGGGQGDPPVIDEGYHFGHRTLWNTPEHPMVRDDLHDRKDPEFLASLREEALRQDLEADVWQHDARTRALLAKLVYARELAQETTGLEALPPAPGLTPAAPERLRRVGGLMGLAIKTLEDAFHPDQDDYRPGELSRQWTQGEVIEALSPIASHIGVKIVPQDHV